MRAQFKFIPSFATPTFDSDALANLAGDVGAANDRVLDLVLDANRRLADLAVTSADRASDALPVALPFADKLPTPSETAASYLEFVERAVTVNREFNQRVVDRLTAVAPVVETVVETVTEPAPVKKAPAKKAPVRKAAAKKASARKAAAKPRSTSN